MLRVEIHLVPWGMESKKSKIGEIVIANDGTGTHEIGSYWAKFMKPTFKARPDRAGTVFNPEFERRVTVLNFPRLKYDVYELLRQVMNKRQSTKTGHE